MANFRITRSRSATGRGKVHDGDGNRVGKNGIRYLVDDNNPTGLPQVMEEIAGGAVIRTYTYGHERISQTQLVSGAWSTSYYGYDAHGEVRFLTDASGAVTDRYEYDVWGNLFSSTTTTPNVFLYQGEQYDSESGLYYLRARYFDPLMGRFLTTDPQSGCASQPRTQHPYLYASTDPVNGKDPTGEATLIEYTLLLKWTWPLRPALGFPCLWWIMSNSQPNPAIGLFDTGGTCGADPGTPPGAPVCDQPNIERGKRQLKGALGKPALNRSPIYQKYKSCMDRVINNIQVTCVPPGQVGDCGRMGYGFNVNITPLGSRGAAGVCGPVACTLLHEITHSCYNNDLSGKPLGVCDQEKGAFGAECQVFGCACDCAKNPAKCGYPCPKGKR